MDILKREKTRITLATVIISLVIIMVLWLCIFITDYIIFGLGNNTLFSRTKVVDVKNGHNTYEQGLGYYVVTDENNISTMYFLGNKIKVKQEI